ncbi:hypothetical protein XENOCAPTIV_006541, partial [Xenoophorus captivus]
KITVKCESFHYRDLRFQLVDLLLPVAQFLPCLISLKLGLSLQLVAGILQSSVLLQKLLPLQSGMRMQRILAHKYMRSEGTLNFCLLDFVKLELCADQVAGEPTHLLLMLTPSVSELVLHTVQLLVGRLEDQP